MRRLSVILLSLLAVSCGSASNQQLETEVARLRIEVDELKAQRGTSEKSARGASHDDSPDQVASDDSQELGRSIRELREGQQRLEDQLAERPPMRPTRPERPRPDASATYALEVIDAPFEGVKNAKVTVVKTFEFACPFCEKSNTTMEQLLKDYKGDIKIAYKHFIVHPQSATEPARSACAADLQGKFSQMSKLIWEKAYAKRDFSRKNIESLAKKANLRMKQFRADRDGTCVARVKLDHDQARAVGATGTPAFFINGRFLSGARPIDQFKTVIDEELAKANTRIGAGEASVANYYQRFVMDRGLKKLETP